MPGGPVQRMNSDLSDGPLLLPLLGPFHVVLPDEDLVCFCLVPGAVRSRDDPLFIDDRTAAQLDAD